MLTLCSVLLHALGTRPCFGPVPARRAHHPRHHRRRITYGACDCWPRIELGAQLCPFLFGPHRRPRHPRDHARHQLRPAQHDRRLRASRRPHRKRHPALVARPLNPHPHPHPPHPHPRPHPRPRPQPHPHPRPQPRPPSTAPALNRAHPQPRLYPQGRAGRSGRATSLYTRRDAGIAALLADALREAGQVAPDWLEPSSMAHLVDREDYRSWDKIVLARRRAEAGDSSSVPRVRFPRRPHAKRNRVVSLAGGKAGCGRETDVCLCDRGVCVKNTTTSLYKLNTLSKLVAAAAAAVRRAIQFVDQGSEALVLG